MPVKAGMSSKPQTAAEWRDHAEELHRRGLEMIDTVTNARDVPTQVAQVNTLLAQTFFAGARSASAIADGVGTTAAAP